MDELPIILAVGIQNSKPEHLIKSILETDDGADTKAEGSTSYSWEVDNKYYSAKLQFRVCYSPDEASPNFETSIEAVIIVFDSVSEIFLNHLDEFKNSLKNVKPAIQMLVCSSAVPENKKDAVEDWCIKNKYELIELKPKVDNEICITSFEECCGIDRVKEVLNAHQWPNLVMKGKSSNSTTTSYSTLQNIKCLDNGNKKGEDGPSDYPANELDLDESFNDMEQLSTLFRDLQTMKRDISSLSGNEKFKQAEKVVKTFWRAMHGHDDEFSEMTLPVKIET